MFKTFILVLLLSFHGVALAADDEETEVEKKMPSYISLGKPMILNLATKKRRLTFLQLKVDVLVMGEEAKLAVEAHVPAIRHEIILLLSEQDATEMKTPSLRDDIRKLATVQVKELMVDLAGNDEVEDILFSSFLIQ